jgi:hypothetical protein
VQREVLERDRPAKASENDVEQERAAERLSFNELADFFGWREDALPPLVFETLKALVGRALHVQVFRESLAVFLLSKPADESVRRNVQSPSHKLRLEVEQRGDTPQAATRWELEFLDGMRGPATGGQPATIGTDEDSVSVPGPKPAPKTPPPVETAPSPEPPVPTGSTTSTTVDKPAAAGATKADQPGAPAAGGAPAAAKAPGEAKGAAGGTAPAAGAPAAEEAPFPKSPEEDPNFQAVKQGAGGAATATSEHAEGGALAENAKDAATVGAPTKATDPEEALGEKKAQAETLKQQFQPSAPAGKTLKITFKDAIGEDVAKDREVDMGVGFSPDTPVMAPLPDGAIVGIPLGPTKVDSFGTSASADPVVAGAKGTRTKGAPPPPFSLARKELSEKNLRDREARRKKALAEGRPFTPSPETAARVYVQGHLISEALGGKAIPTNLQTINISLNKRMSDVENEVVGLLSTPAIKDKKELRDDNGKIINKAFRYMVTTSPGPAKRGGDLSLVPSSPANDDLHAQEQNLISSVTITAEEIVNIKGRGIEEGDKKIGPTPLEHVLDLTFIP